MHTQATEQALGGDEAKTGRQVVGGHPHISQTNEGTGGIVGVQSGQDQMACL